MEVKGIGKKLADEIKEVLKWWIKKQFLS
jgi:ERCC4-type nuclease